MPLAAHPSTSERDPIMEELRRIEDKIERGHERDEQRHNDILGKINLVWDRVTSVDKNVAVMQEKGDSTHRLAVNNEVRITALERTKHFLAGAYAILAALGTAIVSWLLQRPHN